ncbi:LuxR C-terminal-related transcriptional regulator [Herbiconiux sp. UC225_62]|uniref:helix-turn-helix transcriptional regulator n=1 Tax=Herbiconiux sp. UC225_62 TaxID=3350168 RepID=UPI0036D3708D
MSDPSERSAISQELQDAVSRADWDAVQTLVERNWSALILADPAVIRDAVAALPDAVVAANPRWISAQNYLSYLPVGDAPRPLRFRDTAPPGLSSALIDVLVELTSRAAAARVAGRLDRAVRWVDEAREALGDATDEAVVEMQYSLPDLHSQWGKVREAAGQSTEAFREFQDAHDLAAVTGNELIYQSSAGSLAWLHTIAGQTAEAEAWLDRVPRGDPPGVTPDWTSKRYGITAHLSRALGHIDRLEYEEADEVLDVYVDVAKAPEYWAVILYLRARLARHTGDAWRVLTQIDSAVQSRPPELTANGISGHFVAVARAELSIELEQPARARQALAGQKSTPPSTYYLQLEQAKIDMLTGDLQAVARTVEPLLTVATSAQRVIAEALVLHSVTRLRSGWEREAGEAFQQALALIESARLYSALTVIRRGDFDALVALVPATVLAGSAGAVLDRVRERGSFLPEMDSTVPLSPRERSVLAELVSGASVAEIANRLFVSQNTVKSQLRSVYRKLGVANRAEAEQAVGRLGLLD